MRSVLANAMAGVISPTLVIAPASCVCAKAAVDKGPVMMPAPGWVNTMVLEPVVDRAGLTPRLPYKVVVPVFVAPGVPLSTEKLASSVANNGAAHKWPAPAISESSRGSFRSVSLRWGVMG